MINALVKNSTMAKKIRKNRYDDAKIEEKNWIELNGSVS